MKIYSAGANNVEKKQTENIFTSNAAAGILTNDLVRIMEAEEVNLGEGILKLKYSGNYFIVVDF